MKIIIIQPWLTNYRISFYTKIYEKYKNKFCLYSSPASLSSEVVIKTYQPWDEKIGRIIKLPFGLFWQLGVSRIKILNGDRVFIWANPKCLSNIYLLFKCKILGATTYWWGHFWSSTSSKIGFKLRMVLSKMASNVIFYNEEEVAKYRSKYATSKQGVYSINNGIDVKSIQIRAAKYSFVNRSINLLFIGRITPKAKLDMLLYSLALQPLSKLSLNIIGEGELLNDCVLLSQRLGIDHRVTWHGHLSNEDDIAAVINKCCLFVYPGAVGLSLHHAFSYGVPAILHDNPFMQMPEYHIFKSGLNGLSFNEGDIFSLSEKISEALVCGKLEEWSKYAFESMQCKYNIDDMTQCFTRIISSNK